MIGWLGVAAGEMLRGSLGPETLRRQYAPDVLSGWRGAEGRDESGPGFGVGPAAGVRRGRREDGSCLPGVAARRRGATVAALGQAHLKCPSTRSILSVWGWWSRVRLAVQKRTLLSPHRSP